MCVHFQHLREKFLLNKNINKVPPTYKAVISVKLLERKPTPPVEYIQVFGIQTNAQ